MTPVLGIIASSTRQGLSTAGFEAIQSVYLSSGTAGSAVFSSIPQTYKHLEIHMYGRTNRGANFDSAVVAINGDSTATNYGSGGRFYGDRTSAVSQGWTNSTGGGWLGGQSGSLITGATVIVIPDYTLAKFKNINFWGGADTGPGGEAGQWFSTYIGSTSAVTSITMTPGSGTLFAQYSRFTLYGIKG